MQKSSARPLPSLSVRIDLDTEGRIGPGKIALLENIREHGSISAAGRAMDMSYKRAWDLVDEINRICRQAAVERQTGGKNGGGAALTPFGLSLVARYRKIERDAASAVRKELQALRSEIGGAKKRAGKVSINGAVLRSSNCTTSLRSLCGRGVGVRGCSPRARLRSMDLYPLTRSQGERADLSPRAGRGETTRPNPS